MRVPALVLFRFAFSFAFEFMGRLACLGVASALLVSCASIKSTFSSAADTVSGAFDRVKSTVLPGDDGPPDNLPADVASIPDAVPRDEPLHSTANRRLAGQGRYFASDVMDGPFSQRGRASWYGKRYTGTSTASDEKFDPLAMTAAHPRLPIPSYARVANVRTTKSVIVRINDRSPGDGNVIALSYAAAAKLGIATPEGGDVEVTRIMPEEYARLQAEAQAAGQHTSQVSAPIVSAVAPSGTSPAGPSAIAPVVVVPPATAVASSPSKAPVAPVVPATSAAASAPSIAVPPARPIAGSNARPPRTAAAGRSAPQSGSAAAPRAATSAAPAATAAAPAAVATPAAARWMIQVGVFAVPENAETVRQQVAKQLAQGLADVPAPDRTPRVETRGNRHFVLVGDAPDRTAAETFAARVRRALKHDVVIVRR